MSDRIQEIEVEDDPPFEVVDDDAAAKGDGPSLEELQKQLAEQQAKLEAAQKASDTSALLSKIVETQTAAPKPQPRPWDYAQPIQTQVPMEDPQTERERVNTDIYKDAHGTINQMIQKALTPFAGNVLNQSLLASKQLAKLDPDTAPFMKKYADEVEEVVRTMPIMEKVQNATSAYQMAVTQVKARHMDDIVQDSVAAQVEAAVAAKLKELGIEPGQPAKGAAKPAQYSESGSPSIPPAREQKKVQITRSKMNELEAYADRRGMPVEKVVERYLDGSLKL